MARHPTFRGTVVCQILLHIAVSVDELKDRSYLIVVASFEYATPAATYAIA